MANYKQVGYGSQGSDVTELQKLLNQNGYELDVDGIFGSKTQSAVKDYQKKNNLSVDGIVGTNTWGALTKAQTSQPTTGSPTQGTKSSASAPGDTTKNASGNQNSTANAQAFNYDDFSYGDFSYADYAESDTVKQANALLQQQNAAKPGAYQSLWQDEIDDYMNRIQNRDPFSYDMNADALYQQYKDNYTQQGKMAMMDTMGQAAALTGGYGNSYAQNVGQQAYNQHLSQLNNIMPELYRMASDRYNQEGQNLLNMYNMYLGREEQDYGRYMDSYNAWQNERDYLAGRYDAERDADYSRWETGRNQAYNEYTANKNLAYDEYSADREQAWNEYVSNQEKEMAAAELMAGAGNYDRLGDVYGLSDDELASIKAANAPKASTGGGKGNKEPTYKALTHADRQLMMKEVAKASTIDELASLARLYQSMGYDPSVIAEITGSKQASLTASQSIDTTVDDTGNSAWEQEQARRRGANGRGVGRYDVYLTTK